MLDTSILLLIIPDHPGNRSIVTGKLFEYIAAGKPIICIGPVDGDATAILKETGHGTTFPYMDPKGISDYLSTLVPDNPVLGKILPTVFSRRELIGKIVSLLEKLK